MTLKKEYDTELLSRVIEYNHLKYMSFKEGSIDNFELVDEYEKILNARYCKVSRVKKRLLFLLTNCDYVWFITFTFDNKRIGLSTKRKRELIRSVLNTHDFLYILNVDYGKTTEREHYHCVLGTNWDMDINQFIQNAYPCFSLSIQCKKGLNDYKRLSKYINKLTNHCLKASTKKQRLVYNFKGYDAISHHNDINRRFYLKDKIKLENDTLLDKGVISAEDFGLI